MGEQTSQKGKTQTNTNLSYKRGRFEEAKVSQKDIFYVFFKNLSGLEVVYEH
jgi:hypothetical protein